MKYLNFFLLLLLFSCTRGEVRTNTNEGYFSSGVEQFLLPELPRWASYSEKGECFKESPIVYLDFKKLKLVHDLTYLQMVFLQTEFNFKRLEYFDETHQNFLKPVEEMSMFSNSLEMIRSDVTPIKIFKAKKYNLIWLESYLKANVLLDLKNKMKEEKYLEYPTLLFSSCKTRWELSQFLKKIPELEENLILIGADFLVPYNTQLESVPTLSLELKELLGKNIEILTEEKWNTELKY